jgi:hypothetical protein
MSRVVDTTTEFVRLSTIVYPNLPNTDSQMTERKGARSVKGESAHTKGFLMTRTFGVLKVSIESGRRTCVNGRCWCLMVYARRGRSRNGDRSCEVNSTPAMAVMVARVRSGNHHDRLGTGRVRVCPMMVVGAGMVVMLGVRMHSARHGDMGSIRLR